MSEQILLGIDPGTRVMGYGIILVKSNQPVLLSMGVIYLERYADPYVRLGKIFESVEALIRRYQPQYLAIEAPFYGKNVQSMLKLGRAQGVAIGVAAIHNIPIQEFAPLEIKKNITGNGLARKEQVARMLQQILKIDQEQMMNALDATDALGAAYCLYLMQTNKFRIDKRSNGSWKDFLENNPDKVIGNK